MVRAVRAATGARFLIIFRLSVLELVEQGNAMADALWLAGELEAAGASIIDTGIGWHEARVPTIAAMVPRAAFAEATRQVKAATQLPVIATNRINTPKVAEQLLAAGIADLVSLARPLLADPALPNKSLQGREAEINTCIACNQGCLDRIFTRQRATCLVNPRAAYETELVLRPAVEPKRIAMRRWSRRPRVCWLVPNAVIAWCCSDAMPRSAGSSLCARSARQGRVSRDTALLQSSAETAWRRTATGATGNRGWLRQEAFDEVVIACGVRPRAHRRCRSFQRHYLSGSVQRSTWRLARARWRWRHGFDVATFLTDAHAGTDAVETASQFFDQWACRWQPMSVGTATADATRIARQCSCSAQARAPCRAGAHHRLDSSPTAGGARRQMLAGVEYSALTMTGCISAAARPNACLPWTMSSCAPGRNRSTHSRTNCGSRDGRCMDRRRAAGRRDRCRTRDPGGDRCWPQPSELCFRWQRFDAPG
jgi:hypothetical protein